VIESRYFRANGIKWEARFFRKGEMFPEADAQAPRQGVWARPVDFGWEFANFVGESWRFVRMDPDLLHIPERKRTDRT